MIVFHVAIQTGDDYLIKRAPHREAGRYCAASRISLVFIGPLSG